MSEELLQRDLLKNPEKIGTWNFYNIGSTTVKQLKEADIIRSVDYGDVLNKKVDGIITKQKEVIAIVENKSPREFNTKNKKDKAILQEIGVARKLRTKLIIVTDTQETLWINATTGNSVRDKNGKELKYKFDKNDKNLYGFITEIIQSIDGENDAILPIQLIDPTNLAKQIWQDVWSVSGATPENCLYTFVELFIFKYLSDLRILKGTYSFESLLNMYPVKTKNKDSDEDSDGNENNVVLQHYANIIRPEIKRLFPENPLDKTTIINGTIFVSKDQKAVDGYGTVFKKVLEKFKNYGKLENIDHDFKSKLFESFLKESISKKNWGQFFTPIKVVRAINEMAEGELKDGGKICDPACGVGKFPLEFVKENLKNLYSVGEFEIEKDGKKTKEKQVKSNIKIVGFDKGFDKDEQKTIILAKANMLIYFCELIKENPEYTKQFAELFNQSFILKTNSILGTLSEPIENEFDLILTNPPYVASGSSNLKEEIAKSASLKHYYKVNAMGVEGLFMEWIVRALKKGGKAFVVVPDGIFNRQNDKNLRQFILDNCSIDAIISLPIKTFFTTPKKTYILAITKKSDPLQIQVDPVFTYLCSEIGESRDIYRFDIEQDDLKEAAEIFKSFKGNKRGFIKLNQDKRCKIQNIENFKSDHDWSIEKFWSDSEKIELGIETENKPLLFNEFLALVNETTAKISEETSLVYECADFNTEYQTKPIEELFDLPSIKGLTATFIQKNQGNIPVYGGKKCEDPIGYVGDGLKDVKYFENCLGWNREGSVGYVFYHTHKFTTNDHHRPMVIKEEYRSIIDYEYMKNAVENVLLSQGFRWSKTASKEKVAKLHVKIPITKKGNFDLQKQKEIAEKYKKVEEIKKNIKSELEKIESIKVDISI
jgi:type I restriction-modification system DNA methylase subunit